MIEHDPDAQAERLSERCSETFGGMWCVLPVGHISRHRERLPGSGGRSWEMMGAMGDSSTVRPPVYTEAELIGQMSEALERMPEAGRIPALRYLMDRYGLHGTRPW